jgi:hypothetical protein
MKANNLLNRLKNYLFPEKETDEELVEKYKKIWEKIQNEKIKPVIKDEKWFRESLEQKGILYVFQSIEKVEKKIPVNLITDELFKIIRSKSLTTWEYELKMKNEFHKIMRIYAKRMPPTILEEIVLECFDKMKYQKLLSFETLFEDTGHLLSEDLQKRFVQYLPNHHYHYNYSHSWKKYVKFFPNDLILRFIHHTETDDVLLLSLTQMLSQDTFREQYIKRITNSSYLSGYISRELSIHFDEIEKAIRNELIEKMIVHPSTTDNFARLLRNHFHELPEDIRQKILEKIIDTNLKESSLIGLLEDFFNDISAIEREKILLLLQKEPKFEKAVLKLTNKYQSLLSNATLKQLAV